MGTHSLIRFQRRYARANQTEAETVCAVYQQYDGYPSGVGAGLLDFLTSLKLCNGIPLMYAPPPPATTWANGIGCLAAQYVARSKSGPGMLYLYPSNAPDEEYTYEVTEVIGEDKSLELAVRVTTQGFEDDFVSKELFSGTLTAYSAWLKEWEGE